MTLAEISNMRLERQHINNSRFGRIKDLISSMGALQAQDYSMSKWAIGIRIPKASDGSVESAIDSGEIIRTHVMRPTWHMVAGEDASWLLELTGPGIKASQKSRNRELELSGDVFDRTNKIIINAVRNGNHLTREELMSVLRNEGIETANNRGSHILFTAELDRIICSGRIKSGKQTYALFSERIPGIKSIPREEALKKIAGKYFFTRGPATLKDFTWWSGLSAHDARRALEIISPELVSETIENKVYWYTPDSNMPFPGKNRVYLLPSYDEFIISYADRSAALSIVHKKRAISVNGIFNPVILIDGQVAGLWKRSVRSDKVIFETSLFHKTDKKITRLIDEKVEEYGSFLKKNVMIIHH